jgi:RecA/RadA recombinase
VVDQVIAQCQAEGGLGSLADTERTRNRKYMTQLGCVMESLVWLGGQTIETMFAEIETVARTLADVNARAWREAIDRAGVKLPPLPTYPHAVYDPNDASPKRKPVATFQFAQWTMDATAALMEFQKANGLAPTGRRDVLTRNKLRPCFVHAVPRSKEYNEAIAAWLEAEAHELVQPADRPAVVAWDSVAGTPTREELEAEADDMHMASAAKAIKRNLRRMIQLIDDAAVLFVLVNQRYAKIERGGPGRGGKESETYGGNAIKYHSTIRIELERIGFIARPGDPDGAPMGQIVKVTANKNKLDSPYRSEEFGLIYGRGADNAWAIYNDLKKRGIIRLAGSWSSFTDPTILGANNKSFQGWMGLSNIMAETPGLYDRLAALYMEGA